jgi:uroporphyrinogen-III synthase
MAPLAGLTVIVARDDAPDDDLSAAVHAAGAVVVPLPLMRVAPPVDPRPLVDVVTRLASNAPWDLIAFTSRHAVQAVAAVVGAPVGVTVAAVGETTARALRAHGWPVHIVGDGGGSALAARLAADVGLVGRRVLWPRAEDAHGGLREGLAAAGATVDDVVAYRSGAAAAPAAIRAALGASRPLALGVTSPQRARLLGAAGPFPADVRVVGIGATTSAACRDVGIAVAATATSPAPGPVCAALAALHTPC